MCPEHSGLTVEDLRFTYPKSNWHLEPFDFRVDPSKFSALIGPSGCGKSTILNIVAGLLHPTAGSIRIDGLDVTNLAPERRDIGVLFQGYSLFQHMTVFDNVRFPLTTKRHYVPSHEQVRAVDSHLDLLGISGLAQRQVDELSGGQAQRVALARALVYKPKVLLLDEPFSALDESIRREIADDLRDLISLLGTAAVLVTHNQSEARELADRVYVMNGGRCEQVGTFEEIYSQPQTRFVAEFTGRCNFLDSRWGASGMDLPGGMELPIPGTKRTPGSRIVAAIRPESTKLVAPGSGFLEGRIKSCQRSLDGTASSYSIEVDSIGEVFWSESDVQSYGLGDRVSLRWSSSDCSLFEYSPK